MGRIRSRDTTPELAVRKMLHGVGYRFRLNRKGLPGTPDIVFPSRRSALFVHGCFWHAHECKIGRIPKTRQDYWIPKLRRNRERDDENVAKLEAMGWRVATVWQCELKDKTPLALRLRIFLGEPKKPIDQAENVR